MSVSQEAHRGSEWRHATDDNGMLVIKGPKGTLTCPCRRRESTRSRKTRSSLRRLARRSRRAPPGACSGRWGRTWSPA